MKNKMFVRKAALLLGLGGLLVSGTALVSSVAHASVRATAVTNGPIYYISRGLKAINADGSTATAPTSLMGATAPQFSADGTKVAWVTRTQTSYAIQVADADGSNKITLLESSNIITTVDFNADKSKLIFVNDKTRNMDDGGSIYEISATIANQSFSAATLIATNATKDIKDVSISKNNDVAYVTSTSNCQDINQNPGYGVMTFALGSQSASFVIGSCVPGQDNADYVRWNSAGDAIFVGLTTNTPPLKTKVISVPKVFAPPTIIMSSTDGRANGLAVSPDGTKLAFAIIGSDMSTSLAVMNTDGGALTTITTYADGAPSISWGPPVLASNPAPVPTPIVPGVTVTDTKIYTEAPKEVAADSAVTVLTPTQTKTQEMVSNTPDVCLPSKDDIVFIDEGRCSVSILSKKSGEVLRRFRTTVVEDEVSELKIGNEIATIAPIFFDGGSTDVNAKGMKRIRSIKDQITAAGNVLVVGHSGIALGDTPQNRQLSEDRAISTVKAMKKVGAKGPFVAIGIGGDDPLVTSTSGKDQDKNRRVVIILVP